MKLQLSDIVELSSGIFRKPTTGGEVAYLQSKHFDDDGYIRSYPVITKELLRDSSVEKHILQDQDIVFAAKGVRIFAAQYRSEIGPAVASSSLIVIRVKKDAENKVLPGYLFWFLSHPDTRIALQDMARGTSIQSVSKSELSKIKVPIPSIERQKKIVRINELAHKEKKLYDQVAERKQLLYNMLTYEWAQKE